MNVGEPPAVLNNLPMDYRIQTTSNSIIRLINWLISYDKLASRACPSWHISHILQQHWRLSTSYSASCSIATKLYLLYVLTMTVPQIVLVVYANSSQEMLSVGKRAETVGGEREQSHGRFDLPHWKNPTLLNGWSIIIIHQWYLN